MAYIRDLGVGLLERLAQVVVVINELAIDLQKVLVLLDQLLALGAEVLVFHNKLILVGTELELQLAGFAGDGLVLVFEVADLL